MAGAANDEPTPLRAAPAKGISAVPLRDGLGSGVGLVVVVEVDGAVVVVVDGCPLAAVPSVDVVVDDPAVPGCGATAGVSVLAAAAGPQSPTTATMATPRTVTVHRRGPASWLNRFWIRAVCIVVCSFDRVRPGDPGASGARGPGWDDWGLVGLVIAHSLESFGGSGARGRDSGPARRIR